MIPNAEPLNASELGGGGAMVEQAAPAAEPQSGAINGAPINALAVGGGAVLELAAPSGSGAINEGTINSSAIGGGAVAGDEDPPPPSGTIFLESVTSTMVASEEAQNDVLPLDQVVSMVEVLTASEPEPGTLLLVASVMGLDDAAGHEWVVHLRNQLRAGSVVMTAAEQSLRALSGVSASENIRAIWPILVQSLLEIPDAATALASLSALLRDGVRSVDAIDSAVEASQLLAAVVESIVVSGAVQSRREAALIVAAALAAEDKASPELLLQAIESVLAGEQASASLLQTGIALELLTLTTLANAGSLIVMRLADAASLVSVSSAQQAHEALVREALRAGVELVILGERFTAVAVTTDGARPISTYSNWNFNSMCRIGQRYFGAGEGGIYELEGDDDDGEPISARILTGEMDFGSPEIKRLQEAYIGYSASGDLVLKVIATHQGKATEFWYRAPALVSDQPSETKINVGRGLTSRYWQFELVNPDGADFELDSMQLVLLNLTRRV